MKIEYLHEKIVIFGSGAFGTASAYFLSKRNDNIMVYGVNQSEVDAINNHNNKTYFDKELPSTIKATSDLKEALKDSKVLLIATPSFVVNNLTKEIAKILDQPVFIINLSKGFDYEKAESLSTTIKRNIPKKYMKAIAKLSGPSFASELIKDDPTIFNLATSKRENFNELKKYFEIENTKLIFTSQIEAIELLSIMKNVYAISLGINNGLHYGKNAEAFLFSQILTEMMTLLNAFKFSKDLVYTASGLWDLYLTGTTRISRNFNFGFEIGDLNKLDENSLDPNRVVEGVRSIKVLKKLIEKNKLELPIFDLLYKIIYDNLEPEMAFKNFYKTNV